MASTSTMIDIIDGVNDLTNRVQLKATFANFGEVEDCFNPRTSSEKKRAGEFPYIRYRTRQSAEDALTACERGQVFLNGTMLRARWRQAPAKRPAERLSKNAHYDLSDFRQRSRRGDRESRSRSRDRDRDRRRSSRKRNKSPPKYRSRSR
mmetsp:Transcript_53262/g.116944  ORF Transcript_53262/g.116944 Transcript_53262/m.116944 type:complete len:150 (+) Transcript_53262:77-526(+)